MTKRRKTLVLTRPRDVAAVVSPARQELLSVIGMHGPISVRELSRMLGCTTTSLYHHLELLHRVGAIAPEQRSIARGRSETTWRAAVDRIALGQPGDGATGLKARQAAAVALLRLSAREIKRALASATRDDGLASAIVLSRGKAWLDPAAVRRIRRHFGAIEVVLHASQKPRPGARCIAVVMGLIPTGKQVRR